MSVTCDIVVWLCYKSHIKFKMCIMAACCVMSLNNLQTINTLIHNVNFVERNSATAQFYTFYSNIRHILLHASRIQHSCCSNQTKFMFNADFTAVNVQTLEFCNRRCLVVEHHKALKFLSYHITLSEYFKMTHFKLLFKIVNDFSGSKKFHEF